MSLDGLRAWIGEVERKLGVRSRVFLVLVAIAIGGAGAAIYLALDARQDRVGESDLQALQEQVEAQAGGGTVGAADPAVTTLEAEVDALREEVEQLRGQEEAPAPGAGPDQGASGGLEDGEGTSFDGSSGSGAATAGRDAAKLREMVEEAAQDSK